MSDAIDILTAKVERLQRMLGAEWQRREEDKQAIVAATATLLMTGHVPAGAKSLQDAVDAVCAQLATCRADTVRRIRTEFDKQFRSEFGEYLSRAEINAILDGEGV